MATLHNTQIASFPERQRSRNRYHRR